MNLQNALQETGIAQTSYDGYTATVKDDQGEFSDMYSLVIQKEGLPPHYSQLFNSLIAVEADMSTTHAHQPLDWQAVEA